VFTFLANEFENSEKSLQKYHGKSVDPKGAGRTMNYYFFELNIMYERTF
jgi:hypothetical protein